MVWVGGKLHAVSGGIGPPDREAELIYPAGYPARFIEVRLIPDPPIDHWAQLGTDVNADGSVCFVTAESWTPQMTVADALDRACDWWFNYWLIVERSYWLASWPSHGKATLSSGARAALCYQ